MVELTIALLRVFDVPKDKIVWDVGHQSYAYKILTDRLNTFQSLRTYNGISGFSRPNESPYDAFISGHASVSISLALGIAASKDMAGYNGRSVAVIGDGAMTGGMALEALNNLSSVDKNVIIVFNDNEMSISASVGGFSSYFSRFRTSEFATKVKHDIENIFEDAPLGDKFLNFVKKAETALVKALTPGAFFEGLGIKYIGPINGHKIKDMESALYNACLQKGPVVVHVMTVKGKGYEFAEKSPDVFHGVSSFNKDTGIINQKNGGISWTKVFSDKITAMAQNHKNIVAITAAMKDGTGLKDFAARFPDRFFDVGIAEQHAVTFSAGLAAGGAKPYCAIYSTFLQRAYDQIIHDVAIPKLPVTLCIDRGGFVGADGSTHHGVFDISYLRCIPNLTVMLPKDRFELEAMLDLSYGMDTPAAIRYARGDALQDGTLPINNVAAGVPEMVFEGDEIAVISAGHIFEEVYKAYKRLSKDGIYVSLINLRFIKPLDEDILMDYLKNKKIIFTVEEGVLAGGAGEMIRSLLARRNMPISTIMMGIEDSFFEHGGIADLRKETGIDEASVYAAIKSAAENLKEV